MEVPHCARGLGAFIKTLKYNESGNKSKMIWEKCLAKNSLGVIQGLQFAESENYPVCLCRVKRRIFFSIVPKQGGFF